MFKLFILLRLVYFERFQTDLQILYRRIINNCDTGK